MYHAVSDIASRRRVQLLRMGASNPHSYTLNMAQNAPKFGDIAPLGNVALSITKLIGALNAHDHNLEGIEKTIDEESRASDRPSIAFKLNDLRSRVHSVLIKLRSYKSCCKDIAEFGVGYDEQELGTPDGMLSFISEMSSFPSQLNKRVEAIISQTEKAVVAVMEQMASTASSGAQRPPDEVTSNAAGRPNVNTHQTPIMVGAQTQIPTGNEHVRAHSSRFSIRNMLSNTFGSQDARERERELARQAALDKCKKLLEELRAEVQHLKREAVEIYSTNIMCSLEIYDDASEAGEISDGIRKIRSSCAELQSRFGTD